MDIQYWTFDKNDMHYLYVIYDNDFNNAYQMIRFIDKLYVKKSVVSHILRLLQMKNLNKYNKLMVFK